MSEPGRPYWRLYWQQGDERHEQAHTSWTVANAMFDGLVKQRKVTCVWMEECRVVRKVVRE